MIDHAVRRAVRDRLSFEVADVRQWQAPELLDVIVSNACFHWVADHPGLLGHLLPQLTDDGVLAFQVPDNSRAPSHLLLASLLRQPEWARRLAGVARPSVESAAWYVGWLSERGFRVNAWETTYHHILDGPDAVFEWMGGTTLRPILAALDGAEQERFNAAYAELLRESYPRRPFGTVFGFRRVFVVAQRGS